MYDLIKIRPYEIIQSCFDLQKQECYMVQPAVFRIQGGRAEKGEDRSLTGRLSLDFPVTRFQGEKSVVLSTLTWSGGSSLFLGLAYTVTGAVTWLASFSMMAIHLMLAKRKMFFPNYKVKLWKEEQKARKWTVKWQSQRPLMRLEVTGIFQGGLHWGARFNPRWINASFRVAKRRRERHTVYSKMSLREINHPWALNLVSDIYLKPLCLRAGECLGEDHHQTRVSRLSLQDQVSPFKHHPGSDPSLYWNYYKLPYNNHWALNRAITMILKTDLVGVLCFLWSQS